MADKAIASASLLLFCDNKKFLKGVNETRKQWEGLTKKIESHNRGMISSMNNLRKWFGSTAWGGTAFGKGINKGLSTATLGIYNFRKSLVGTMGKMTPLVASFGSGFKILGGVLGTVFSGIVSLGKSLLNIFMSLVSSIGNVISGMVKLGAVITTSVVAGLIGIATYSVRAADKLEKLQKAYQASGGTQGGYNYLKKIASKNPNLNTETAVEAGSAFIRMGKSEAEAGNAVNILANATAKFGKGKEAIGLILTQMEQLNGKTGGFTQDLNAIQNSLPDVKQKIMQAFNVKSIDELTKKGVTGKQINDAIIRAYADVPTPDAGLSDYVDNIKNQLLEIAAIVGSALLPFLKNIAIMVSSFLTMLQENPQMIFQFVDKVIQGMAMVYNTVVGFINNNMQYIGLFMNLLIQGASYVVGAFKFLVAKTQESGGIMGVLSGGFNALIDKLSPLLYVLSTLAGLFGMLISAVQLVLGVFLAIGAALGNVISIIVDDFISIGGTLKNGFLALWEELKAGLYKLFRKSDKAKEAEEQANKRWAETHRYLDYESDVSEGWKGVGNWFEMGGKGFAGGLHLLTNGLPQTLKDATSSAGQAISDKWNTSGAEKYRPKWGSVEMPTLPLIQETPTFLGAIQSANNMAVGAYSGWANGQSDDTIKDSLKSIDNNTQKLLNMFNTQNNNNIPVRY